jgi:serine/threonine protein kinase
LRAAVEALLSTQPEGESFFARGRTALVLAPEEIPPRQLPSAAGEKPVLDEQIGVHIGRYKVLQRLGEGGCGVVYMAEQQEPVRRLVAVKIIKPGMDTRNVIGRFDAERQALAMMDHLNIARVLDAGATEAGRPYFVMELVRGVKITEYCDQNNLTTRQRLGLFVQICQAIQHAHQKGVIHRDIKPSNILVTLHDGVPVPKVIDFGIAKAIAGRLTEQTQFTAYEQIIGTPAYMSPEQAEMSGLDVDTRSDIYSLGVLLYELLTGRTPFDGRELMRVGLDEMRRKLREDEPCRPSTILTTLQGTELRATTVSHHAELPKLISLLKGDLDWVVMKALEKDRTRRYETANGFAMDIQRYLNNEPVIARPPSRWYRLRKLVRRNRGVFAAAAAVALALVAGMGTSTWLFLKEKEARREQVHLREQAERAERRENDLRRQAEAKEKINQAAIYVSQDRFEEADKLLDEVTTLPAKPSFDGVNAFRRVGEWHALQGRWQAAANHFLPLLPIDQLDDWGVVTLDYQACGVVLAESGDRERFALFCRTVMANYGTTTNGDLAGRLLKTCLLTTTPASSLGTLEPLGRTAENFFGPMPAGRFPIWATIPVSLWKYRCGDYSGASIWCQRELDSKDTVPVLDATIRIIYAMACYQRHDTANARSQLDQGRKVIEDRFRAGLPRGNGSEGYWYDWVFAHILLREANELIPEELPRR